MPDEENTPETKVETKKPRRTRKAHPVELLTTGAAPTVDAAVEDAGATTKTVGPRYGDGEMVYV